MSDYSFKNQDGKGYSVEDFTDCRSFRDWIKSHGVDSLDELLDRYHEFPEEKQKLIAEEFGETHSSLLRKTSKTEGCLRCRDPWSDCGSHHTHYLITKEKYTGVIALCEECWLSLTPQERLPFYRTNWERSKEQFTWEKIEHSVLSGG